MRILSLLLAGAALQSLAASPADAPRRKVTAKESVETLLDDLLGHLYLPAHIPHNASEIGNPPSWRLKKDEFLNEVLGLFGPAATVQQRPLRVGKSGPVNLNANQAKATFVENLISQMTVPELVLQLHLFFADNAIGVNSDNGGYTSALSLAPTAGIGVINDWYPTNISQFNSLQELNLNRSRLHIPFMVYGECVHGVGSFKQSMFPQAIGLAASFDTDLTWRVGRAIGSEARAIGIHACLAPVLDLGKDPRWGRVQEAWGEDYVHTAIMGTAFSSGLSKNGSWADPDAVVPVLKHFAAYGSPRSGLNAAPFMGRGMREVMQEMLVPFKAAIDLGGARGVMMSYNELDEIPAVVHPDLYGALEQWGFDGFVTADDTGMAQLMSVHGVAGSPADAIAQWFNAGGMIDFYDYPLDVYLNATVDLVKNGTVKMTTLQGHVRKILGVKYDLGLFNNPFIPENIDVQALTTEHVPLTLEAAQKSIVLLENRNQTLPIPLDPTSRGIKNIALIGPFSDILNYGDYSGQWGAYPANHSSTLRQAMLGQLRNTSTKLTTSWGSDTWTYHGQYNIPAYLLGGMRGTYFARTDFSEPVFTLEETPNRDWGLYPPPGLPSNNFSVVWDGELTAPVSVVGWIGVAVSANCSAALYIDGRRVVHTPATPSGNILGNIMLAANTTAPPPGGAEFEFVEGAKHKIRVEFQAFNLAPKRANFGSLNAEVELFWNLVGTDGAVERAVDTAKSADLIVLAVGANWNSDGENGDRATLGLSVNQTALADAIFDLGIPVVLVLQGGRPFAIPEYYAKAAAVLDAFFPGQSGGQAISDVLFGLFNPGARVPLSVPFDVGTLPVYYNYKATSHVNNFTDESIGSYPVYSFGYGLSYTTFAHKNFKSLSGSTLSTSSPSTLSFSLTVQNTGSIAGSYVAQIYLLRPAPPSFSPSAITRAEKQLVASSRVYLGPSEDAQVVLSVDVERYLRVLNREWRWEVPKGRYTFAVLEHSGWNADTSVNVTLSAV